MWHHKLLSINLGCEKYTNGIFYIMLSMPPSPSSNLLPWQRGPCASWLRWGTSWTCYQPVTVLTRRGRQPFTCTFTLAAIFVFSAPRGHQQGKRKNTHTTLTEQAPANQLIRKLETRTIMSPAIYHIKALNGFFRSFLYLHILVL